MHELGLVFYVIDNVEKLAKENHVKSVKKVTLEVGEVSTVVPSYFRDCFTWAIKKSEYMKNCELNLVIIQGISYCRDCKETYPTVKYGKECPHCHSDNTYLVTGSDVMIKNVEVEE
ncbi:MAG: hydrogenase maturation nickel metallochaperone HypA [Bacilli bacterium]|nr:hydrogenase maturation nickel metallochaperone HypA [Bacilli bacterium]